MPRQARAAEVERPTRSGPVRPAATPHPTARATTAARPRPLHPTLLYPDARVGGDAAKVLTEVGRRLDVGPELAALVLVAKAVEDAPTGHRDRDALAERRTVTLGNLDMSL
ncbi:MAG: hypothetical protein JO284_15370 [Planctomycetaceae bacterium]|nr:hypothetical protein [Planctomycetaceae bacterium]MBV8267994.1 hypothetical protein [Planctomycetaceae bacterium]